MKEKERERGREERGRKKVLIVVNKSRTDSFPSH